MIFDRNALLNIDEDFFCLQIQLNIVVSISINIIKLSSIYIKQTLRFLFRFLKINFGEGTLCYGLCHNIKASVNKLSANGRTSGTGINAIVIISRV